MNTIRSYLGCRGYLLGYSTISINIDSAKYLSDALLTLLQLIEIILVKQILKQFRVD